MEPFRLFHISSTLHDLITASKWTVLKTPGPVLFLRQERTGIKTSQSHLHELYSFVQIFAFALLDHVKPSCWVREQYRRWTFLYRGHPLEWEHSLFALSLPFLPVCFPKQPALAMWDGNEKQSTCQEGRARLLWRCILPSFNMKRTW